MKHYFEQVLLDCEEMQLACRLALVRNEQIRTENLRLRERVDKVVDAHGRMNIRLALISNFVDDDASSGRMSEDN